MQILRTLLRVHVSPERLDQTVGYYEQVYGQHCSFRFKLQDAGLEVAIVADVQMVAGSEQALLPMRDVSAAWLVDSVESARTTIEAAGGTIMIGPLRGPHGSFIIVRHPDGTVVECADSNPPDAGLGELGA